MGFGVFCLLFCNQKRSSLIGMQEQNHKNGPVTVCLLSRAFMQPSCSAPNSGQQFRSVIPPLHHSECNPVSLDHITSNLITANKNLHLTTFKPTVVQPSWINSAQGWVGDYTICYIHLDGTGVPGLHNGCARQRLAHAAAVWAMSFKEWAGLEEEAES